MEVRKKRGEEWWKKKEGEGVGGIMTLPVWWPGRSITAGLSLRRN